MNLKSFIHHSPFIIIPRLLVRQLVVRQFHRDETRRLVRFDRRLEKDQKEGI